MTMNVLKNSELWDLLRSKYPNFRDVTSKATKELFTTQGFEALDDVDGHVKNDFFDLTLRLYLQKIDVAEVKDNLALAGFGEELRNEYGGITQRLAISLVKAVDPAYLNLQNGQSVDPYIVRKGNVKQRFFKQNYEFQNMLTVPDDTLYRNAFVAEAGMDGMIRGMIRQLDNSLTLGLYTAKLDAISGGINSTIHPLKETQKIEVPMSDEPTAEELSNLILSIKNVYSLMTAAPVSGAYNAMGFESSQDGSRLKLLVRTGLKNEIAVKLTSNIYNAGKLDLPVDIIEVNNFGGLIPIFKKDDKTEIELDINYDEKTGAQDGYSYKDSTGAVVKVADDDVSYRDPNENVLGIMADKDLLFTSRQGNYSVESIRNPRGLYTNYFASLPRTTIGYDALYNMVTFTKADSHTA